MSSDDDLGEILKDHISTMVIVTLHTGTTYSGKILAVETAKDGGKKVVLQAPRFVNSRGEHLFPLIRGDRSFRVSQIHTWIVCDEVGGPFEEDD